MKTYEAVANSAIKSAFNLQSPLIIGLTDINLVTRYMSKYKPFSQMVVAASCPKLANQVCISRSMNGLYISTTLSDHTSPVILKLLQILKDKSAI